MLEIRFAKTPFLGGKREENADRLLLSTVLHFLASSPEVRSLSTVLVEDVPMGGNGRRAGSH